MDYAENRQFLYSKTRVIAYINDFKICKYKKWLVGNKPKYHLAVV